jgi:hypothetical protein
MTLADLVRTMRGGLEELEIRLAQEGYDPEDEVDYTEVLDDFRVLVEELVERQERP